MKFVGQRTLRRIGDSLHISIPIQWIRANKLKDGSVLKIEENNKGNLEIIIEE